MVLSVIQ
ncbi:hypothetical protein SOVF_202150, partial [Spinacia oleracea]